MPFMSDNKRLKSNSKTWDRVLKIMAWVLTTCFDGFTLSGLPASVINMGFAIGCWYLPVPHQAAIGVIVLSSISITCNTILTLVPTFRRNIDELWMNRNGASIKHKDDEIYS